MNVLQNELGNWPPLVVHHSLCQTLWGRRMPSKAHHITLLNKWSSTSFKTTESEPTNLKIVEKLFFWRSSLRGASRMRMDENPKHQNVEVRNPSQPSPVSPQWWPSISWTHPKQMSIMSIKAHRSLQMWKGWNEHVESWQLFYVQRKIWSKTIPESKPWCE